MTYAANSDLVWSVTYVYDSLDRISEVWYTDHEPGNIDENKEGECRYRYTYTSGGSLAKVENAVVCLGQYGYKIIKTAQLSNTNMVIVSKKIFWEMHIF